MSFAFAGALAGGGNALQEWAADKRKEMQRAREQSQALADRKELIDYQKDSDLEKAASLKALRGSGSGRGRGKGGKGKPGKLTKEDRDSIALRFGYGNWKDFADSDPSTAAQAEEVGFVARRNLGKDVSAAEIGGAVLSQAKEATVTEQPGLIQRGLNVFRSDENDVGPTEVPTGRMTFPDAPTQMPSLGSAAAGATQAPAPDADALAQARAAIAAGANRNAVVERLRGMNVDPSGL